MSSNLLQKYRKSNHNKFLYLRKKIISRGIISNKSVILKSSSLGFIKGALKKHLLKTLFFQILTKTSTKKPLGAKLGGGKSKIRLCFNPIKKYQLLARIPSQARVKLSTINVNLNIRLKRKCY